MRVHAVAVCARRARPQWCRGFFSGGPAGQRQVPGAAQAKEKAFRRDAHHLLVLCLQELGDAEENLRRLEPRELVALGEQPENSREDADALSRVNLAVIEAARLLQHRRLLQAGKGRIRLVVLFFVALCHGHRRIAHALQPLAGLVGELVGRRGAGSARGTRHLEQRDSKHCV